MRNFSPPVAIGLVVLYTLVIGIGMYLASSAGHNYGTPELMKTLWWVEIILTTIAIGATWRYASWKQVGFGTLEKKYGWWLAIPFATILFGWSLIIPQLSSFSSAQWQLFLLVGFTTALVGFSEELVFRGFALRAFLQRHKPWVACLVSAGLFSLLHAVNIAGGQGIGATFLQLVFTFIFGLFTAPLALRLNNLWPLIVMHWQWDFVAISGQLAEVDESYTAVFVFFLILANVPLWWLFCKNRL
ncbi:CPBP family intramembrane glutamic endopeptidase [Cochlodiniinecator piscidefendens]|uniref:CPBP family intramembrane glutamic endopeptidase n=1 Tax=Cochlodiniinecator piscidefendens TaxID=2715756 RepID=UPI00140B2DCB|nr:CPBP family intramembrane glutamic endopeptidase [Cochlodiniinecator piscidefendens]